ncbi:MAG: RNA methyltransferase [Alistipes sp.]|nr:RNA methyltransferase [Alistipes sp.]MBQ3208860.1 RNA methyltransferase [Alistipes sp.]
MTMRNIENNISVEQCRERIEYLAQFMLPERLATLQRAVANRTKYMTLLAENMFHPQNASALVRHCEAFGVQNLHTVQTLCKFNPNVDIVRGTDKWIDIHRHNSTAEALAALKSEGYRIIATTPHRESCTPESFDVTKGKFAIVMGTEKTGISDEVMAAADEFMRIPMCGMVESLNVSACAAIIVYMLSERMRHEVEGWQLTEQEQTRTLYKWIVQTVKDAEPLLKRGGFL